MMYHSVKGVAQFPVSKTNAAISRQVEFDFIRNHYHYAILCERVISI
jgi:hypothetical protein